MTAHFPKHVFPSQAFHDSRDDSHVLLFQPTFCGASSLPQPIFSARSGRGAEDGVEKTSSTQFFSCDLSTIESCSALTGTVLSTLQVVTHLNLHSSGSSQFGAEKVQSAVPHGSPGDPRREAETSLAPVICGEKLAPGSEANSLQGDNICHFQRRPEK